MLVKDAHSLGSPAKLNYKPATVSAQLANSSKVLEKLPKNLYSNDSQEEMRSIISQANFSKSQGGGIFDTYTHGFDMQASNQLQRISGKLDRWQKTQETYSQRQIET